MVKRKAISNEQKKESSCSFSFMVPVFRESLGQSGMGLGGGLSRGKEGVRRRSTGGLAMMEELQRWGRMRSEEGPAAQHFLGSPPGRPGAAGHLQVVCRKLWTCEPQTNFPLTSPCWETPPGHLTAALYACLISVLDCNLILEIQVHFFFFLQNLGRCCSITWFNFLLLDLREVSELSLPPRSLRLGHVCLGDGDPAISPFSGSPSLLSILTLDASLLCVPLLEDSDCLLGISIYHPLLFSIYMVYFCAHYLFP